jgi:hypothetical protein
MEPIANDYINRNFDDAGNATLLRIDDEWWFEDFNSKRHRSPWLAQCDLGV